MHPIVHTLARIFSPAVWAMLFCLLMIIAGLADMDKSQGWSLIIVWIFLPFLLTLLVLDLLLRFYFRVTTKKLWLIEFACVLLCFMLFWIKFY